MMPKIAAGVVVRVHQIASTSAGKLPAAASEKAHATIGTTSMGSVAVA